MVCDTETGRPSKEAPDLPSELDDIVLMAMRKEPARRYGSAVEFADDLRRFLDGRPVVARQDSVAYRVRKFIRRNSLETTLITMMALSLVVGLFISIAQTRRAQRAQRAAESERVIAQRETATAAKGRTRRRGRSRRRPRSHSA